MSNVDIDNVFAGSMPKIYDTYLVPLIFEQFAVDLASRVSSAGVSNVLEIAAGTGVLTRALASTMPGSVSIVATDLNQGMLDQAAGIGTTRPVEWRRADAMQLPFPDDAFDVVVCQFGVMFFPDKPTPSPRRAECSDREVCSRSMPGIRSRRTSLPTP